jgi:hypothetical protein
MNIYKHLEQSWKNIIKEEEKKHEVILESFDKPNEGEIITFKRLNMEDYKKKV